MQSKAITVAKYLAELPIDRAKVVRKLRSTINGALPSGFKEQMQYGMIGWVVPHSKFPAGYHCDPKQPLPFMALASQAASVNIYHMGLYADPVLLEKFQKAYAAADAGKLDMGKSCLRLRKFDRIPFPVIAWLAEQMAPDDWICLYQKGLKRKTRGK